MTITPGSAPDPADVPASGTDSPTASPATDAAAGTAPVRRGGVRPGTIVWGLVVALLGTAVVAWGQGLRFDLQLAAIGVLAAAGVVLVATSLSRSRDRAN